MRKILLAVALLTSAFTVNAEQAKPFHLKTLNGQISLSKLKGQIVYLDFWASWCHPCRKSFPWMNTMLNKYQNKGLKIVAVSLDSQRKHTNEFLKKMPVSFTIALDPDGKIADEYGVEVMPTAFLIGRNGKILWSHRGFLNSERNKLEAKIVNALN